MTVIQSIPYALFCMTVVFFVLICLWGIIKVFSYSIGLFVRYGEKKHTAEPAAETVPAAENTIEMSCGELKLRNVDEPTAAMIMAIVSYDSGIPLDELCFKSIRAKD